MPSLESDRAPVESQGDSQTTNSWARLIGSKNFIPTSGLHSLRPGQPGFLQALDREGNGIIAVNTTLPYGRLTDEARSNTSAHLLSIETIGQDFSILRLPVAAIGLKAAALGTGSREVSRLLPVFCKVGKAIGSVATLTSVPSLRLRDFALDRSTGEILFVPPINFGARRTQPLEVVIGRLAGSLARDLQSVFHAESTASLEEALNRSFQEQ